MTVVTNPAKMPPYNVILDNLPQRPTPAPWTASRCNRTLRKLDSFVKRLEKWHKDFSAFQKSQEDENSFKGDDKSGVTGKDPEQEEAVAWLSKRTGKGNEMTQKKTYASRGVNTTNNNNSDNAVPKTPVVVQYRPLGQLSLITPKANAQLPYHTVKRPIPADRSMGDDDGKHGHTARKNTTHKKVKVPLTDPRMAPIDARTKENASLERRLESIIKNGNTTIISFLVATSDPRLPTRWDGSRNEEAKARERGAKSLVSMCLAKLSGKVVEEQKQSDAKNDGYDGQCDIVGNQIDELQIYFGDSEAGWAPLRMVTRTCGIAMVARLVESGMFPKHDARGLAVPAFSSPLLADFGKAIAEVLVRMDTKRNESYLERGGTPGYGAYGSYNFDQDDHWRQMVQFRWLTLAIRQEENPMFVIQHLARYHVLRDAYLSCITIEQVAAAELIETTYRCALWDNGQDQQGDLYHERLRARTGVNIDWEVKPGPPLSALLENRFNVVSSLFYCYPTEWTSHLLDKICTQIQLSMERCEVQDIPSGQKLVIAHAFFIDMCLAIWDKREVRPSLPASFETLLSWCDSGMMKQVESRLVGTLLKGETNALQFMAWITLVMGIRCAGNNRLQLLVSKVCAEAAMDYAADEPEQDTLVRSWASGIEAESRILRDEYSTPNDAQPGPHVQQQPLGVGEASAHHGYRWDEDVREWVGRTPKKTAASMFSGTMCDAQLDGAYASPLRATKKASALLSGLAGEKPKPKQEPKHGIIVPSIMNHGLKRKSSVYVFEVHRDDEFDFEYKKPRLIVSKTLEERVRLAAAAAGVDAGGGKGLGFGWGKGKVTPDGHLRCHRRRHMARPLVDGDESADELSLLLD